MSNHATPLDRAKKASGGAAGLALALNKMDPSRALTPQAISQWKQVPADRAADVAAVTGIACHELRPDVFREPARAS
jgi:DNA-binding transcriptional regulator YdaS (Cro superfamily)